ncbi:MAG: bifunctional diaminohydroxyphosphoribosylaminopyrimidine deaminase/5-amino-6-(5-phosphoribosylamino)uracil reductase RibD [Syntrophobacteraceae bacterium]|nr:bifunctional diaminohydroxyphosphoribosylaminopyrimidine deaminase/5-amino-6-(5-phosphoribosylamino)uracil reductase RibD [Syntrophobacteraceae bacterium]
MAPSDPDVFFMKKALRLAVLGAGMTSPNPQVGAVVVSGDSIVGKGYHKEFGGPHAEVNALAEAGPAARGSVLYVTLEPCNHYGQTPPCTRAILEAGVARVVFGMGDPNPDVAGGGGQTLRQAGVEVRGGVFEQECRQINQPFIKHVTTGLPYVILKSAATLDGFIATSTGESKWITGESARRFGHLIRSRVDGIVVGIGTVLADDPQLTARLPGKKKCRQPVRIVLDSDLRIPPDCLLVSTMSSSPVWVVCGLEAPAAREEVLKRAGARVIRLPAGKNGGVEVVGLLQELGQNRMSSLLVEGGGHVLGSFMDSGQADEFYFFYAPKILGDPGGVSMVAGAPKPKMIDCVKAHGLNVRKLGEDLLVNGRLRERLH